MIGPHYERIAEIEQRMTAKQMLEKIKHRPDNPLSRVIDKLKKEFTEYQTAYSDPIMDYQISSLDRILSFDSKLGPILDALQKENLLLRKELGVLEGQLSNTVGICQQILAENNELKLIVRHKNEDINKIIETIAGNQAEEVSELEEKNSLLMRENSILMIHLEEIKKQHQKYAVMFRESQGDKADLQRKIGQMKKQVAQSLARQRQLSRKISLLEQSTYQNSEEVHQLRQAKETLTFENNELKNQVVMLEGRGEGTSHQTIRRQIQGQYQPILEQHKLLKRQRGQLLREAEKIKLEKEKLEDQQLAIERQANKANGDLQMTNTLLNEQKARNVALKEKADRCEIKINELKEESNKLRADKETASNYALTREKRLLQENDDLRRNFDVKLNEAEGRIREISKSMQALLQSKEEEIKKMREETLHLQRLLEHR